MSIFNQVKKKKLKYNTFNLSHEVKLSHNLGQLIPIYVQQDVLPGDKFKVNTECLVKFAPLVAPMYQRVDTYVHYFFVPYRLLDHNFKRHICNISDESMPQNVCDTYKFEQGIQCGSIFDYLGMPITHDQFGKKLDNVTNLSFKVNCFALRAYLAIWASYYRDQNLQTYDDLDEFLKGQLGSMPMFMDEFNISGISTSTYPSEYRFDKVFNYKPLYRCWKKDYFTSALPHPQATDSSVVVPLRGELHTQFSLNVNDADEPINNGAAYYHQPNIYESGTLRVNDGNSTHDIIPHVSIYNSGVNIDINDLRRSNALQKFLENTARGGKRYIEQILSHFGVVSSDARLQRPEYLGGGRIGVNVSEVVQQSQTTNDDGSAKGSPLGNYAGHAVSLGSTPSFEYRAEEHGVILGIMSVMPQPTYMNGLPRQFTKMKALDFAFPEFANLGEQEVYDYELDANKGETVFGYQSRYAEYKYSPSRAAGEMRTTQKNWHMARNLIASNNSKLNSDFVECNPNRDEIQRVFAILDTEKQHVDTLYTEVYNHVVRSSKLPYYGVPIL